MSSGALLTQTELPLSAYVWYRVCVLGSLAGFNPHESQEPSAVPLVAEGHQQRGGQVQGLASGFRCIRYPR